MYSDIPSDGRKIKKPVVTQLADSLKREGLLHPIGVRHDQSISRYVLVFGRHRLEAAKKAGWIEIAAVWMPDSCLNTPSPTIGACGWSGIPE